MWLFKLVIVGARRAGRVQVEMPRSVDQDPTYYDFIYLV